jgi:predicted lipoprotein with Yx(FWY)xxD motif
MRNRWLVGASLVVAAVALAACGSSSPSDPAASNAGTNAHATDTGARSVTIRTMKTSKGTVLVDAQGHTLYWFAKDTKTKSNCNGSCTTYWPPVLGKATAGAMLPHGFGTIKRANGETQATYDGHPLYTYSGDTSAGQVTGNGLDLSGGLWWAVTPSGKTISAHKAKSSSSSGGSGSSGSGSSGSSGGGSSGGGW